MGKHFITVLMKLMKLLERLGFLHSLKAITSDFGMTDVSVCLQRSHFCMLVKAVCD